MSYLNTENIEDLTPREAREIVQQWGDAAKKFDEVKKNVVGTGRWTTRYEGVYSHSEEGWFLKLSWSEGSTERQSEKPFEYGNVNPVIVEPKKVEITKYVPVHNQ